MKGIRLTALPLAVALAAAGCRASSTQDVPASFAADSERVMQAFRDANIDEAPGAVRPADDGFLYSEVAGNPVFFRVVGERVYIFTGNVVQVEGKQINDLTAAKAKERNARILAKANMDEAIVYAAKGAKKARVLVFTDPSCGFCKRFHEEVPALNAAGIEVAYLAMPRAGIDSPAGEALRSVHCATDRKAAIDRAFHVGYADMKLAPGCDDDGAVVRQRALADELRLSGTPGLFLESGEQVGGYLTADALIARVAAGAGEASHAAP